MQCQGQRVQRFFERLNMGSLYEKPMQPIQLKVRADQVGSLLRPAELLQARQTGVGTEELQRLEDKFILEAIRRQQEIGLDILTDGEFRRQNFMSDFVDAVAGFDTADAVDRTWSGIESARVSSIAGIVTAKLRLVKPLTGREVPFMQKHAPGKFKITLPSATQFPATAIT